MYCVPRPSIRKRCENHNHKIIISTALYLLFLKASLFTAYKNLVLEIHEIVLLPNLTFYL